MHNTVHQGEQDAALTQTLAHRALAIRFEKLPTEIHALATQCILDWIAVALAGSQEPLVRILLTDLCEQGGHPQGTIVGHAERLPVLAAALVNGAASHALDYDDVNLSMTGHPTVAVLPGVLALAEQRNASGRDLIAAFVAGYEAACDIGARMGASHYARGFHATATIGSFGSAAACAHLLRLDPDQTAHALGIAGTQAAGLKSMFGTMCKPLHAGKAAYNGLIAARLAARGFDSRKDVLETVQGFAATQSDGLKPLAPNRPATGFYLRENLFKYHAACYLTHAGIECGRALREQHGIDSADIRHVALRVDQGCDKVCNIVEPRTGLEAKFSLRQTAAFALAGVDTARLDTYDEARMSESKVAALRNKVSVELLPDRPHTLAEMEVELVDGRRFSTSFDTGIPASSVEEQGRRIDAKFLSLASPVLGQARAEEIREMVHRLDRLSSVAELTRLLVPSFK
ncbi:MAG TPA: MmgE/PrpD family protein [Noviherbaspirillum sp.]|uniref:MmgE/PrpD family protein n=1 Tax=Noviherbaspirillum sp. TaxID=1926288 RepID=UPI002B45BC40|nr:MmgE/PrpD family protein [Noviherbaspirillum sp.]HJV84171.1 MmgE/PrpD family protein [Noviherbaspirillum sp.]